MGTPKKVPLILGNPQIECGSSRFRARIMENQVEQNKEHETEAEMKPCV